MDEELAQQGLKSNFYLESRNVLDIFEKLGPEEVGMYVLLQSVQQPISIDKLAEWSHLSIERVVFLCGRLGMLHLGIIPPLS